MLLTLLQSIQQTHGRGHQRLKSIVILFFLSLFTWIRKVWLGVVSALEGVPLLRSSSATPFGLQGRLNVELKADVDVVHVAHVHLGLGVLVQLLV